MARIEVKEVRATMTRDEREPHWEAVVSYGLVEVVIPLPARQLPGDGLRENIREPVEAMESLARALLRFADHTRKQSPNQFD